MSHSKLKMTQKADIQNLRNKNTYFRVSKARANINFYYNQQHKHLLIVWCFCWKVIKPDKLVSILKKHTRT